MDRGPWAMVHGPWSMDHTTCACRLLGQHAQQGRLLQDQVLVFLVTLAVHMAALACDRGAAEGSSARELVLCILWILAVLAFESSPILKVQGLNILQ